MRQCPLSACLPGTLCSPAGALELRLEATTGCLLGPELAGVGPGDASASIITPANSLQRISLYILCLRKYGAASWKLSPVPPSIHLLLRLFLWRSQTNAAWLVLGRSRTNVIMCRPRRNTGTEIPSVARALRPREVRMGVYWKGGISERSGYAYLSSAY